MYYNNPGPGFNYGWSQHVIEEPMMLRSEAKKVDAYVSIYLEYKYLYFKIEI